MAIADYETGGGAAAAFDDGMYGVEDGFADCAEAFAALGREATYHDRRFAHENGACPRCASPAGKFGATSGACACGFRYGSDEA